MVLYAWPQATLVYVCRRSRLCEDLKDPRVMEFLTRYGYAKAGNVEEALSHLCKRFSIAQEFPHEIGAFLGYPIGDVIGFVQNEGKNSKCTGYWKVYEDEEGAKQAFAKIKKCTNVYSRAWQSGTSICRLTVAA